MASVEKHRDAWRVRWRDDTGRQHAKSFKRKRDADDHAATVEADRARGVGLDPAGTRTRFTDYADAWAARQIWRPSTRATIEANLAGIPFAAKPLTMIRRRDIEEWVADLTSRLAPTTVEARYRAAVAVFRAARRDQLIRDLPTDGVRLPKRMTRPEDRAVALDRPTLAGLLDALGEPGTMWRDLAAVMVMTGLRPSEAAGITADRVQGGVLVVDRQLARDGTLGPPKTPASVRTLPLPERVQAILDTRPVNPAGFVFVTRQGSPPGSTARGDAWRRSRIALADTTTPLPDAARGWHTLRHTYASTALAAGMDPATLSRMLGHATVAETLTTYSHALPGAMDAAKDVVSDALGL